MDWWKLRHLLWMVTKLDFEAGLLIGAGHTQEGAHLKILMSEAMDAMRALDIEHPEAAPPRIHPTTVIKAAHNLEDTDVPHDPR